MIQKIINYCWFGGNPLPELAVKCIESWKKYCPDYQIIEWNENNFDMSLCEYMQEAYACKKWAFITDYVRLYVLYKYGGIYMDTDVEVIASLDPFLKHKGFTGFENPELVPTGIMAAEAGNSFIGTLLKDYDGRHFLLPNGQMDMTTNTQVITKSAAALGLRFDNTKQELIDFTFYPCDYFCPKDSRTLKINLTKNTVTIHHFAGSWGGQPIDKFKNIIKPILGERLCLWISKQKKKKSKKKMEKN